MHDLGTQTYFLPGIPVILKKRYFSCFPRGFIHPVKTLLKYGFEHCHAVNENTSFSFLFFPTPPPHPLQQLKEPGLLKYLTSYWVGLECLQKASFQQGHLCPVPGRKGDFQSENPKNIQPPFPQRAALGIEGRSRALVCPWARRCVVGVSAHGVTAEYGWS